MVPYLVSKLESFSRTCAKMHSLPEKTSTSARFYLSQPAPFIVEKQKRWNTSASFCYAVGRTNAIWKHPEVNVQISGFGVLRYEPGALLDGFAKKIAASSVLQTECSEGRGSSVYSESEYHVPWGVNVLMAEAPTPWPIMTRFPWPIVKGNANREIRYARVWAFASPSARHAIA